MTQAHKFVVYIVIRLSQKVMFLKSAPEVPDSLMVPCRPQQLKY